DHDLGGYWSGNGERVDDVTGARHVDLADLDVERGDEVRVRVSDPTEFVRDRKSRRSAAMSFSRAWTVSDVAATGDDELAFTPSTSTERPTGGDDVVFVETTHPAGHVPDIRWALDETPIDDVDDSASIDLGTLDLDPGTYELT